ncbi:MAG: glycoside hydrolase family 13 protein [Clostridia bacterium]|nr:glycoside hydrolase family 13 protein [Clostridia bacterium]
MAVSLSSPDYPENKTPALTITKYENGVRRDLCGAFSRSSLLTFSLVPDPALAVRDIVIRLEPDGGDWRDIPFERQGEAFSLTLSLAELAESEDGGLFWYEFLLIGETRTLFTDSVNNEDFCLTLHNARRFSLLVCREDLKTPEWFSGGVIYQIFPDRFCRGSVPCPLREEAVLNPDWENGVPQFAPYRGAPLKNNEFFGGTLWGVAEKLNYLASLGVTALYLNPIFEAASNHKYDTGNYEEVDPAFGGEEALENLLARAKERGIRVVLDGVFNHTGDDSLYFNRYGRYETLGAAQSEKSPYRSWYRFREDGSWESWWGIPILPRLNHEDPACRRYFLGEDGIVAKRIRQGAGGWRIDVADELTDSFLREMREAVKAEDPDAVLIGEVWENAATKISYGVRRQYLLGRELDSVMNYPFRSALLRYLLAEDAPFLSNELTEIYASYPRAISDCLMNVVGTHDTERILTVLGGVPLDGEPAALAETRLTPEERLLAEKRLMIASAIQYCVYGVPSLYYGDEAGMEGYHDPFCRRPYPWGRENAALLAHYRRLGAIRREEPVLRHGEYVPLEADGGLFAFSRKENGEELILAANAERRERRFLLPAPCLDRIAGNREEGVITLAPLSFKIWKRCR